MKRILGFCLVFSMLFALASCGDTVTTSSEETSSGVVSETVSEDTSSEDTSSAFVEDNSNVALNKRVYSSSENFSMSMVKANIVDGKDNTSWASDTTVEDIDEWIMVDLGKNYNIEEITIDWGMSYASEYTVSISRGGIEFTEIFTTSEGAGGKSVVPAENAVGRYVKVNSKKVVSVLGTYMGATIKEISVKAVEADDQTLGSEKEAMVITKTVQPTENDVYVMGRNYKFNELIWAGATYEYKCTGSVAGAVLKGNKGGENIRFEVSIDGGEFTLYTLQSGATAEFIFAEDLDESKEHVVCIMKTGDVWEPKFEVEGVIVDENSDIVKNHTRDYDLKIEFIGDSITSGGVTNGYAKSYVYLTADAFNANFNVVSRSGQGLYKHVNFETPGPLKSLYAGVGAETGDYQYGYDADLVVLNIGTNDGANVRNSATDADKEAYRNTFKSMYVEMLELIHKANPDAIILCTGGLMGDIGQVKPQIQEAVTTFKSQNPDVEVHLEYLSSAKDAGKDTAWHPGVSGHAKGAEELIEIIKGILK